tara:strand:- start:240 stop:440 length:201 start_codon:yes stop_codon:yes gene_type:complete
MLYFRCPSCKTNFAKIELLLEERMNNLKNSKKTETDVKKILIPLGIINPCCTMRVLTYVDTIKLIK